MPPFFIGGAPGEIIRPLRGLTPQGGRSLTSFAARCFGRLRRPQLELRSPNQTHEPTKWKKGVCK
jgi:hypothetical protein